jgi:hypothetical protein
VFCFSVLFCFVFGSFLALLILESPEGEAVCARVCVCVDVTAVGAHHQNGFVFFFSKKKIFFLIFLHFSFFVEHAGTTTSAISCCLTFASATSERELLKEEGREERGQEACLFV